ncbi:MAG: hypothetical protein EON92_03900 [Burkholderiales bacterium]|nr:MAG: hypothetical protein EON92_03900 [Burkholderiales bacterium]
MAYRKVSAAHKAFVKSLNEIERFDSYNQGMFSKNALNLSQIRAFSESSLLLGYRAFESFVRDAFLLYASGKSTANGRKISSYLAPKDADHAERMMKAGKPFLDWFGPESVVDRSELYLATSSHLRTAFTASSSSLKEIKHVRNHVAHNSSESAAAFSRVLISYHGVLPLSTPSVGEYLLLQSRTVVGTYVLRQYLGTLRNVALQVAG